MSRGERNPLVVTVGAQPSKLGELFENKSIEEQLICCSVVKG